MNIDTIFKAYLVCALWSTYDDTIDDFLDESYTIGDIAPEALAIMRVDVEKFVSDNYALLQSSGLQADQIGHDFWLTRNGHGAGFWDRGLGEIGQQLKKACVPWGTQDLYIGDDGKLHIC